MHEGSIKNIISVGTQAAFGKRRTASCPRRNLEESHRDYRPLHHAAVGPETSRDNTARQADNLPKSILFFYAIRYNAIRIIHYNDIVECFGEEVGTGLLRDVGSRLRNEAPEGIDSAAERQCLQKAGVYQGYGSLSACR